MLSKMLEITMRELGNLRLGWTDREVIQLVFDLEFKTLYSSYFKLFVM